MSQGPAVGESAPPFELQGTDGVFALVDALTRGPVLLVFYPGDNTAVCTKQLCDYRDNIAMFGDLGVQVVGINAQSLESHLAFAGKHELPFPLLADTDGSVCRAYGARGLFGMTKRALFLVGTDGTVEYRRIDLPFFHRSSADLREVLGAARVRAAD